ncbi:hypothetical protein [Nannocystis bainbridge]|uniref:Uncharacterized protein n=1 Tax=Nannocystis bainbridge TaxID=2995303 RepID=A0ABT5DZX4_9BACT|nr:hypothetical protein [Nannocystis bainbridge]MDC0719106.1 hypothetical protein [Nannocystis bainbridge]
MSTDVGVRNTSTLTGRAFPSSVVVPVAPSLSVPPSVADALTDVASPIVALASAVLAVVLAGLGSSAVDPLVPSLIGYAPPCCRS